MPENLTFEFYICVIVSVIQQYYLKFFLFELKSQVTSKLAGLKSLLNFSHN